MDNFTVDLATLFEEFPELQEIQATASEHCSQDQYGSCEGPPINQERPGSGVNRAFCVIA
uniref:B42 mating pheromone Phb2.2 n=1 Tax=Coprinopsis cinerea TaxID=5346 RepID=Q9Y8C3_COPCI|nr:B42 mating pheromone precursor Phb2.2 [Coprinopsis cinerea]